jgi:hypothetical protein
MPNTLKPHKDRAEEEAKKCHLEYLKDCSDFVGIVANAIRRSEKRGYDKCRQEQIEDEDDRQIEKDLIN